ncbi:MAG TPA: pyruvate kinase alpha/beta domain-containing protein [Methanotrichaceae archaeon]|nr:pyruvate kinase alpha/beta domain-containing protein [Methanotrichaceae archaeon]
MESKIVYFEDMGPENTEATFRLVQERLKALGIKKLVLASTTGATARKAMEFFKESGFGVKLIVVPHQYDFHRDKNAFPEDLVRTLKESGHEVHFGTMLFHTDRLYESTTPTVMANLLRCFCQGVKVCFEIVLMVTDAGLVASGEKVVAIAGTGRGSDTALVMQAASSQHLRRLKVNEIICKPLNPLNIDELRELRERRAQERAE